MKYFSNEKLNDLALRLRAFAEKEGESKNTVFWKVLRNKVIVSICQNLPTTIEEFRSKRVRIGNKTIQNHGEAILEIVNEWLESNPIVENNLLEKIKSWGVESSIDKVLNIKQGGFYYNVSGNDALIFHKYLGYKLYGVKKPRTGFPVSGQETVLKKLDKLSIDYDLLNQSGNIVVSKRFERNCYEIINLDNTQTPESAFVPLKDQKRSFKERLSTYIHILQGVSEGVDVITGETIEGLSEDVKLQLFEMSVYFDNRLKSREAQERKYPKQGQKWTLEEDEQLLAEYKEGRTLKELSQLHCRSVGAIRSRLLNLNVLQ